MKGDIEKRLKWKKYHDPLFAHYNIPKMTASQKKEWYWKKKRNPEMLYQSITSPRGRLLGFLNIFDIDWAKRKAELGIYFSPDSIDKGYGTEAIMLFLPYYFESLNFREMYLNVASLNKRAIKCYYKCGFEISRTTYYRHDPRSKIDIFGDARFRDVRKYFKREGDKVLVQFKVMKLSREKWHALNAKSGESG